METTISEKKLTEMIAEARNFLEDELAAIDGIENITFQLVCMFALIDCMAQESANYPTKSSDAKEAFCKFILKHQRQCDYMEKVEPITLYYHIEEFIDEVEVVPGFALEKEVTITDLGYLYAEKVKNIINKGKAEEILEYISRKKGDKFAANKANQHKFISLLYRMRSKAVHEMSGLGESWRVEKRGFKPNEPYYRDVGRCYMNDGKQKYDNAVELVIPNSFVRNILADCIKGYLEECSTQKHFPFSNNRLNRIPTLTWYDK